MPEVSFFTAYYIYGLLRKPIRKAAASQLAFATLKLRKPIRKTAASQLAFATLKLRKPIRKTAASRLAFAHGFGFAK